MRLLPLLLLPLLHANEIDDVLKAAIGPNGVPGLVAMVATGDKILYQGAFGNAEQNSLFRIHSMTKPVTTVAAMQLVEQGKLQLDAPASRYLPELANPKILTGYTPANKPILTPAQTPITLRHLLSHSSGLGYTTWDDKLAKFPRNQRAPLLFEPGTKWQYGTSTDMVGLIVERISGQSLEAYFQSHIFAPLGITEITYFLPTAKHARLVPRGARQPDGTWKEERIPVPAKVNPGGGGGLVSTAAEYTKFLQLFLRNGQGILKPTSLAQMRQNQIGPANVRMMISTNPATTRDFGFHLDANDKFGLGFQVNPVPYKNGRAANSMAWAGFWNTFFWIDPDNNICAVLLMQTAPFFDEPSIRTLQAFEQAVYKTLR